MNHSPEPRAENALAAETSPYLRQHAHNPVDWLPWGETALERARAQDKPILLSVGYSACHWCHVMAHESFEDGATAAVMNELYVNIKVDREERPDIDKIYQLAHQLLTRRTGGWPLTMFLTPDDQAPFFGGTYFPDQSRHGMPSFQDVLRRVADYYRNNRSDIRDQNQQVVAAIRRIEDDPASAAQDIGPAPMIENRELLEQSFDKRHGGFGQAPKFPHPTHIERLMRVYARANIEGRPDPVARDMSVSSLRRMALGGIYDQLGGGFARYSVDNEWMIPHFEKMLYDNGPLLALNARAYQLTGEELFARIARETADWTIRDMQSPEGGYYSSLDADSEGEEGKFYVWTPEEVKALLAPAEYALMAKRFGLDRDANFEGQTWNLHVYESMDAIAQTAGLSVDEATTTLDRGRGKLLAARNLRVWPGRDEKVLTSWNALMVRGMALAAGVLDEPRYLASAHRAVDFLVETVWQDDRLLATYMDGRAHLNAYLDDYAFLLDALLHLLEARWHDRDLRLACALADTLLDQFADQERGGFYFTANDHETLLLRSKSFADDALPSGNAIAALALGRLGHLLGETRYLDAARSTLTAGWGATCEIPHAHDGMLDAAEEVLWPPQTIVLRGQGASLNLWHKRCRARFAPNRMTVAIPTDATDLPSMLALRAPRGEVCAYVCEGHHCEAPIDDFDALETALRRSEL